jgi:serine/threonine-protein kinase HipA
MRSAKIFYRNFFAGILQELERGRSYLFSYEKKYVGPGISLTMPLGREYEFDMFPAFFEGLLPEGAQLEALLRERKIDRNDLFSQLMVVGGDTVGAVTLEEIMEGTE